MVILKRILFQIKKYKSFTCCHCNVNSLTAHNMLKLTSTVAYNSIHKYDFICISETYLDSSIQSADRDISINGYSLIHADHPSNNKRGSVCIYYHESLAVQLVKISYLTECLLCEVSFINKKVTLQSGNFNARSNNWWVSDTQICEGS